ncbi:MAG: hypothetical protein B7X65_13825 [Polaromonas sp. 39-63-25]|nr:MAG: hypothetical protein B7X65_13825 [Polaromonas sp. 39-63-25]
MTCKSGLIYLVNIKEKTMDNNQSSHPAPKIAMAFVKAKRQFGPALKEKNNPAFRSKYADLGACIDAVEDALLANGIAFIQETFEDASGVTVETVFLHESGETIRCGKLHVPASKQDPQGYGSALTYARRYSLTTACGIAPEDDDGNAASNKPAAAKTPVKKAAEPEMDMSPKARANRITIGVAAGDAAGAAIAMAGWDKPLLDSVWTLLDAKTQTKLTAEWPKETA